MMDRLTVYAFVDTIVCMKAIAYIRVSTAKQATEGISLEAQQARIQAWATANGYEVAAVHVDAGLSGGRASNRPALQQALTDACKFKAALVVYSLSRLARSTRDCIAISDRLSKAGADLVSLTERLDTTSAAGKLIFRLLAAMAEFEKDIASERTAAVMAHKKSKHEHCGGLVPYGWRLGPDGVRLVVHPLEQRTIRDATELQAAGLSLRQIGQRLTANGILPRSGGRWHAETVKSLLMAPRAA